MHKRNIVYKNNNDVDFLEDFFYEKGLPIFSMMVGLPGSGKSTILLEEAQEYSKNNKQVCMLSSDALRKEYWGDERVQKNPNKIFNAMEYKTIEALKNNKDVFYDATNISSKKRRALLLKLDKQVKCYKRCYLILASFEECVKRQEYRDRKVPTEAILKMYYGFNIPYFFEGWDEIVIIKNDDNWCSKDKILSSLMLISHDNPNHKGTIGEHCFDVAKNKVLDTPFLKQCGLLHDIGKLYTKKIIDNDDGYRAVYYNHDNVGAYVSLFLLPKEDKWSEKLERAVLIQNHMQHFFRKDLENFYSLLGEDLSNKLKKIEKADLESKF